MDQNQKVGFWGGLLIILLVFSGFFGFGSIAVQIASSDGDGQYTNSVIGPIPNSQRPEPSIQTITDEKIKREEFPLQLHPSTWIQNKSSYTLVVTCSGHAVPPLIIEAGKTFPGFMQGVCNEMKIHLSDNHTHP